MNASPPAYAWDWFVRQRLLWREVRSRLAASDASVAARYRDSDIRADVTAALREDYTSDHIVRHVVDDVVRDLAFLGRTDATFAEVGAHTAPRGMRWWWTHLTGEELEPARREPARGTIPESQLTIADVLGGYGDDRSGSEIRNRLPGSSGS